MNLSHISDKAIEMHFCLDESSNQNDTFICYMEYLYERLGCMSGSSIKTNKADEINIIHLIKKALITFKKYRFKEGLEEYKELVTESDKNYFAKKYIPTLSKFDVVNEVLAVKCNLSWSNEEFCCILSLLELLFLNRALKLHKQKKAYAAADWVISANSCNYLLTQYRELDCLSENAKKFSAVTNANKRVANDSKTKALKDIENIDYLAYKHLFHLRGRRNKFANDMLVKYKNEGLTSKETILRLVDKLNRENGITQKSKSKKIAT